MTCSTCVGSARTAPNSSADRTTTSRSSPLGMLQRVVPALEARAHEGGDTLRLTANLVFSGEERVPVEVDPIVDGAQEGRLDALHAKELGLDRRIGGHRVHPTLDQVGEVPRLRPDLDASGVDSLADQHPPELGGPLVVGEHHPGADEVRRRANGPVPAAHDHVGRVLKDRRADHEGLSFEAGQQDVGVAGPEIGAPAEDRGHGRPVAPALPDADLEALGGVAALGLGRVVAGELELMAPLQLEADRIACGRVAPRDQKAGAGQPKDQRPPGRRPPDHGARLLGRARAFRRRHRLPSRQCPFRRGRSPGSGGPRCH